MENSYRFFRNPDCTAFPCHEDCDPEQFNCLFCYCPFYYLGDQCGGNFEYIGGLKNIKSCVHCTYPHVPENYEQINNRLKKIINRKNIEEKT